MSGLHYAWAWHSLYRIVIPVEWEEGREAGPSVAKSFRGVACEAARIGSDHWDLHVHQRPQLLEILDVPGTTGTARLLGGNLVRIAMYCSCHQA